jgi:hypothetical protein
VFFTQCSNGKIKEETEICGAFRGGLLLTFMCEFEPHCLSHRSVYFHLILVPEMKTHVRFKAKSYPFTGMVRPLGLQEVEAP